MESEQPKPKKRISEIAAMGRIEKILEPFAEAEKRRIAFVFAEQCGLKYLVPTNGDAER